MELKRLTSPPKALTFQRDAEDCSSRSPGRDDSTQHPLPLRQPVSAYPQQPPHRAVGAFAPGLALGLGWGQKGLSSVPHPSRLHLPPSGLQNRLCPSRSFHRATQRMRNRGPAKSSAQSRQPSTSGKCPKPQLDQVMGEGRAEVLRGKSERITGHRVQDPLGA